MDSGSRPLLTSSSSDAGNDIATFRITPAWKRAVNEAAASISAGLHRRNFRRRAARRPSNFNSSAVADPSAGTSSVQHRRNDDYRSCVERLVHRSRWRYFYMSVVLANLLLAVLEPTSVRMAPDHYTPALTTLIIAEMFMSLFYAFDLWMRWFAGEDVARDWWARGRVVIIVCIFGNGILSLLLEASNFSRVLRPLLLIERLRNVRKIAASVLTTLPKIFQVLFLLTFLVMFGGVAAFTLFAGITGTVDTLGSGANGTNCEFLNGGITWLEQSLTNETQWYSCSTFSKIRPDGSPCTNYFDTIWTSMMHLFILITTANYPDIMMPVYDCSRWASLFFVVYILLGLYFLLSLILAIVYTHFSSRNTEMIATMAQKRESALTHAFYIMSELTQQHAEDKLARPQGKQSMLAVGAMGSGAGAGEGVGPGRGGEDDVNVPELEHKMMSRVRHITLEVWLAVVQVYRPQLPIEVSECLFSMYTASGGQSVMNFEEFCGAIDHTRLRVRTKKGATTRNNTIATGFSINENKETGSSPTTVLFCCSERAESFRRMLRHTLAYAPYYNVRLWDGIMDLLICINTLFLFLRLSPGGFSKQRDAVLSVLSNVLLFIFAIEILLKIFALGFKPFWDMSTFNRIDFITVGGGMISTILFWSQVLAHDNRKIADFFLLVRAVRTLRVLRMNTQFRVISATVGQISPALLRYLAVLVALFYAFAVVGMELFAGMLSRDCYPDELATACEQRIWRVQHSSYGANHYWSNNFSSLSNALVVLFQQMVVNNWVIVMEGTVAASGNEWPRLYFILFWVCCVVIVMNVLIAFLIDAYQAHVESTAESVQQHEKSLRRRLDSQISALSSRSVKLGDDDGAESKKNGGFSAPLLRRTASIGSEDLGVRRKRRLSAIDADWMRMLMMESYKLGHDLSSLDIRLEKGVGDIYSEVYTT